jgi:hypothetical protein
MVCDRILKKGKSDNTEEYAIHLLFLFYIVVVIMCEMSVVIKFGFQNRVFLHQMNEISIAYGHTIPGVPKLYALLTPINSNKQICHEV